MGSEGHQGYRAGVPQAAGEGLVGAGATELGFLWLWGVGGRGGRRGAGRKTGGKGPGWGGWEQHLVVPQHRDPHPPQWDFSGAQMSGVSQCGGDSAPLHLPLLAPPAPPGSCPPLGAACCLCCHPQPKDLALQ